MKGILLIMNNEIISRITKFVEERNWDQFHSGENLAKALIIEAAELLELFQWKHEISNLEGLKDELADVFIYAIMLSKKYDLNIEEIITAKLKRNEEKYPVSKAYGRSNKYNEL
jgi:NTP pyrophosphatase (non-canonical NTP hydrolase)